MKRNNQRFRQISANLRREYGGVKEALAWCASLNMNQRGAAEQLQISAHTVKTYAQRYGITLRNDHGTKGYARCRER